MKHTRLFLCAVLVTITASACGHSNPSAPSSATGATVNGSIVAPGSSAPSTARLASSISAASTAPAGLQVSVAGSANSALVDAAGHFSLKNVPPGLANLQFTAPGFSATLGLTDLQSGQVVDLQLSLASSAVTVESDHRANGREEQLEGRVESLPPTTAAGSLVVAGKTVTTNASTKFWINGVAAAFADLAIGQRVHVKGQTSGTSLLASSIEIQNTNTSVGLNVNGLVSGFTGTSAAFQFTVNGTLVKGDSLTEFFGNSQFADLANGARVEVKGSQRDGYIYATRIHVN